MNKLLRRLFAPAPAQAAAAAPLRRRTGGVMLLEPRFMFDGAAVGQVVDQVLDNVDAPDAPAEVSTQEPLFRVDVAAAALAQQQVRDYLARVPADEFNRLFLQDGETADAAWLDAAQALREDILNGRYSVDVEFLPSETLRGAWGAFAAEGPHGGPVVYLNADWVRNGASSEYIARVLVEELGHAIDARLNPGRDTDGDEGELFSVHVYATGAVSESLRATLRLQDDHRTIEVNGQQVQVEFASLNFTNAYAVYTGAVGSNTFLADKEQNRHHFDPTLLGVAKISDGTGGQSFSGNDISVELTIGATTYYGWISRPIKDQGIVRGFYFWKDASFTSLAAAQTDGNQDRDGTAADNSGFILVVDQSWFNSIGYETGGVYKFVGSSSDRVDSALNSVMPSNSAPNPVNDTQTIAEDATATGNVLTNDSDPNNDTPLSVTQFVINGTTYGAAALGVAQTIAGVGTFTLTSAGAYTFTPDANYYGTVPAITYTVSDGKGGTSTAVLSITVTPANDAPTGSNDAVTTSEDTTVILGLNDFGTFTDVDGDRLSAVQITTLEADGSLEYYNGTAWVAVTLNQVITAADIVGGKLRFVPDASENGSPYTTIGFKVSDGTTYSASAYTLTVNVTAVNTAPVANADNADGALYAVEAGCTVAGSNQTGNVLTNDSDADSAITAGTTHKVTAAISAALTTAVSVTSGTTSTSSPATVTGLYGTLKIGADGSYIYEVDNTNAQVQALRTTSNTLTETFTYTMADSSASTASSTLTVVIKGSNDSPSAMDDRDTVQETAGSGTPTIYGSTSGNTLTNDSDVDSGDTLTVNGSYATATGNSTGTSTITLTGTGLNSISANDYVFVNTSPNPTQLTVGGVAVRVGTSNNGSITLNDSSALRVNDQGIVYGSGDTIGFSASSTASGNYKTATYSSTAAASSTTIDVSSVTGAISQGMTVTSGATTRTVTGLTFDANGNVSQITLNSAVSWSGASLSFSAAVDTTLTGRYGTFTVSSVGAFEYKLTSNALASGQTYTEKFSYRTTDAAGCTSDATVYITVNGSTGVTMDDETGSTAEDTTLTVADGAAGDLLVGDSGVTTIASFIWGGQTATAGNSITVSGIGTLQINANGSYSFTPASNYTGSVPVATYYATDGQATPAASGSATLTITITSANDAPTGSNDSVTTPEDTAILLRSTDFGVFSDSEGATLSAVRITTLETDGTLQKYNGSSWVDVALNDEFTAADLAAGKLRFVPDADESASPYTTVGFEVSDGTDWSASAYTLTVNVTPVNDAPVNTVPAAQSLYDYQTLAIGDLVTGAPYDLSVADVDGPTDISSVVVSVGYGTLATSNGGGGTVSGSGSGTVTLSGTATQLNAMLAALVYTPNTGFSGTDALKIHTVDAAGASDTDFVDITVNPDNRSLSVTGTVVNEASPYVMFTVDGVKGQRVSLAAGETGTGEAHASMGVDFLPNLQYFNGTSWVDYTGGYITIPDTVNGGGDNADGILLVRAAVLQDTSFETTTSTYETLKLTATNAAGTSASGNSQIRDDKAGSIYLASNNTSTANTSGDAGYPTHLDDDRPVSINSIAVNEGSPYAVFTVTGTSGLDVSFALSSGSALIEDGNGTVATDGSEDAGALLEIWTGSAWQAYTAGDTYTLTGTTTYIRTAVNPDTVYEGQHTFFLGVTRKAVGDTTYGAGNIFDDGTGTKYTGAISGGSPVTSSSSLDDDRSISVDSHTVNEASSYVVFTVTGNSGQTASLALVNESSGGTVSGKANIDTSQTLKVWDGLAWVNYDADNLPTFDGDGKIFVRVDISNEHDAIYEGSETFKLNATLTGTTTAVSGTATIVDDGTGVTYPGTFTSGSPTTSNTGLEDDRILAVSNPTVNEGSPYVIFEVSGTVGDTASLALSNASGASSGQADLRTSGTLPTLQYYSAGAWTNYNAASPPTIPAGGTLLVRVAISAEQESALDGPETFKLVATNASNQASTGGTATITDDGSGSYFAEDNTSGTSSVPSGVTLDDDRTLSVDSMTVNEASDYVVFTVTGDTGKTVQLSLVNESAGGTVSGKANVASQTLKVWSGSAWVDYDASNLPTFNASGKVFVRVSITSEQDTPYEGSETFKLSATQSNRAAAVTGTATIVDDGTGVKYPGTFTGSTPTTESTGLDDDRTLSVNNPTVNEGSPYAIFEVSGVAGQTASLSLSNASGGGNADLRSGGQLPTLQYYSGGVWNNYNAASPPTIPAGGTLLVRVAIDAEQEKTKDGPETFKLVATSSNGQASTGGTATITDDGTGSYFAADNTSGTSSVPSGVTLDDDRAKAAPPPSPPAAPGRAEAPPPPPPEPAPSRPQQTFNSVLPPASRAPMAVEPAAPIADSLTSVSGFRVVVNSMAPPGLNVHRGITDQFVDRGAGTKVSLPFDAFIHSKEDAVIKLDSKRADDSPLPPWVSFDPANGTFDVRPPPGFTGRLDIKVTARDDEGREATAIFRLFVGEQPQPAPGPQSRDSFSEKIKAAAKRPVTLIRVSDAEPAAKPRQTPARPVARAG